jgi:hypothetical protein
MRNSQIAPQLRERRMGYRLFRTPIVYLVTTPASRIQSGLRGSSVLLRDSSSRPNSPQDVRSCFILALEPL